MMSEIRESLDAGCLAAYKKRKLEGVTEGRKETVQREAAAGRERIEGETV